MKVSLFNSLKFRMPLVVLLGVLPVILGAIFAASYRAAKTIHQEAKENITRNTQILAESVSRWEESNLLALVTLSEQPDIMVMNPEEQIPVLATVASNYQHIYLAITVDQNGKIVARSDNKEPGGYSGDRYWFQKPMEGEEITRQVLISRTIKQPALCFSTAIRQNTLTISGVLAICSDLEALTQQVGQLKLGQTGYTFIVDESGTVLAHPNKEYLSGQELKDLSNYPPVKHFLSNNDDGDIFSFKDDATVDWISYHVRLSNGWGVIAVQEQAEFFSSEREFENLAFFIAGVAVISVSLVTWILANRLIAPISSLTNAASAIANGEFDGKINLKSQDELGILAYSFNQMKGEIKSLVNNLEQRIEERTYELKKAKEAAEKSSAIALAANHSKDRFIANISHELRTPLHSIIGYNRLVQKDKTLNSNHSENLKIVEKSSVHLLSLINDLLDTSQVQLKQITLYPSDLELASFLDEVIDLVSMSAKTKNIALKKEYNNLPLGIQIDEKRLRQILLNLLSNSIKFTNGGEVTLKVSATSPGNLDKAINTNNNYLSQQKLCFEVIDTGVGMTEKDIKKIFQPFEQVGDLQSRSGGAGLGLAISSELVNLMGGKLQVKSQLGVGSTFWFDLVVPVLVKLKQIKPEILTTQIRTNKGTKPKILVVDDKEVNRNLLVEILQPKGLEVFTANNGEQMLQIAGSVLPDLILLDLFMPVKTGFTSIKEIRQDPQLKNIPIIVVTASSITKETSAYLDCEAVLHKPIDEQKLFTLLNQYVSHSKLA
ncbi:MAG: ATP-binding protein [Xenococcaceae cyanobacterium MO_207.B15]|nr:ATP-binding protein [Xenococcaceae cyanobacterium MO_207.B15]